MSSFQLSKKTALERPESMEQEVRNQPFALQFLPAVVKAIKTQMLSSILVLVYTSVILSRKGLGV